MGKPIVLKFTNWLIVRIPFMKSVHLYCEMGKKEQVPARAIFVQGSLWVWSATSRGVVLPMGD